MDRVRKVLRWIEVRAYYRPTWPVIRRSVIVVAASVASVSALVNKVSEQSGSSPPPLSEYSLQILVLLVVLVSATIEVSDEIRKVAHRRSIGHKSVGRFIGSVLVNRRGDVVLTSEEFLLAVNWPGVLERLDDAEGTITVLAKTMRPRLIELGRDLDCVQVRQLVDFGRRKRPTRDRFIMDAFDESSPDCWTLDSTSWRCAATRTTPTVLTRLISDAIAIAIDSGDGDGETGIVTPDDARALKDGNAEARLRELEGD